MPANPMLGLSSPIPGTGQIPFKRGQRLLALPAFTQGEVEMDASQSGPGIELQGLAEGPDCIQGAAG